MTRTVDAIAKLVADGLAAAQASGQLPPAGDMEISVEQPPEPSMGDFSTSLPLKLARPMKMAPIEIGKRIAAAVAPSHLVSKVTVAAPGFINFTLSDAWLRDQVASIRAAGLHYGETDAGKGEKVQLEFVSVNPTGPLHVGHARGAVIGSGMANVLQAAGYDVQREYYVNDAGNQMKVFYDTLYARFMQATDKEFPLPDPAYPGEYLTALGAQMHATHGRALVGKPKEQVLKALAPEALRATLANIRKDLEDLGVRYDLWFSERSLIDTNQFVEAVALLESRGYVADREGAKWFVSTLLGEEKDNVIIRSGEGGPTYFGTDIAYHYNKFIKRGFSRVINVWGADHHGHVSRMKAVVKALGVEPTRLTIVLNQLVSFKQGEETVKFSKRKGNIITVRELIDEVGPDACRFIFLSRSPDAQMEFDLDLAKKQSSDNPVFYVQYAHARLCSVLRMAAERKVTFADGDVSLLTHPREMELIRKLTELPENVFRSATRLEPHHLPYYAMELAKSLQRFYEECQVIPREIDNLPLTKARLLLVDASRVTLSRALAIMGMTAPERMDRAPADADTAPGTQATQAPK